MWTKKIASVISMALSPSLERKKYFSFNNDFYAGPQAIWKEHFKDLAHNPDLTYGFVFPLTATSIKLFPKNKEKPMTEEK